MAGAPAEREAGSFAGAATAGRAWFSQAVGAVNPLDPNSGCQSGTHLTGHYVIGDLRNNVVGSGITTLPFRFIPWLACF